MKGVLPLFGLVQVGAPASSGGTYGTMGLPGACDHQVGHAPIENQEYVKKSVRLTKIWEERGYSGLPLDHLCAPLFYFVNHGQNFLRIPEMLRRYHKRLNQTNYEHGACPPMLHKLSTSDGCYDIRAKPINAARGFPDVVTRQLFPRGGKCLCNEPWQLEPVGPELLASFKRDWASIGKKCLPHAHTVCSGRVSEEAV